MKVLVTGAHGQLGHDVVLELVRRGHEAVGVDVAEMDITDADACARVIGACAPDAVIHCAAFTAVDAAQDSEALCRRVNALGTEHIAKVCAQMKIKMMYISTDYVFSGAGETPWQADCTDFAPLSVYGQTKLHGEQAVRQLLKKHFIVRIAWVFGKNGKNFVRTMLALSEKYNTLRVVCDQVGTPTYTPDLARLLVDMIETEKYGTYHATNEGGYISWHEFACEIFRLSGKKTTVLPVPTAEYGLSKAARPLNSRLDKSKLLKCGFEPLPHWRDALARYLKEIDA